MAAAGAALALALVGAGAALTGASAAVRDAGGACPPAQTDCHVWDDDPGSPGNPGNPGGGGDSGGPGGSGGRTCTRNGDLVPCYDAILGWFNQSDGCYYRLAEPTPPDLPDGQQAYFRSCATDGAGGTNIVYLDEPPPGFGAPPNPGDIAAEILASMTLAIPEAHLAPGPGKPGLVGLPVWLWTGGPAGQNEEAVWGPQARSRTDRGLSVTLTAAVEYAQWRMGNGAAITCRAGEGKPNKGQGERHTTQTGRSSCGYDGYPTAGRYGVSVTTHWKVTWTATNGQRGEIPNVVRTSQTVQVTINELQVVTR
ncbi:hypothetical protein CIK06_01235 [Plantactinospora sp. KBS50]|nr:hypothetical protein CIK06_01235 [Plantactinospora sp. KBS50]